MVLIDFVAVDRVVIAVLVAQPFFRFFIFMDHDHRRQHTLHPLFSFLLVFIHNIFSAECLIIPSLSPYACVTFNMHYIHSNIKCIWCFWTCIFKEQTLIFLVFLNTGLVIKKTSSIFFDRLIYLLFQSKYSITRKQTRYIPPSNNKKYWSWAVEC